HAASAILAREAFGAAADPKRFPKQLQYLQTWQAKRIVWNISNFSGSIIAATADQTQINVGLYNPLLGKSYGEIAAQSRSNHKSQGFGSASQRGDFMEFFNPLAGEQAKTDLFEGIDLSWNTYKNGKEISDLINKAEKYFDDKEPSKSVETLLIIRDLIKKAGHTIKTTQVDNLIIACTGLWFEANSAESKYAVGDTIPVRLQAIARIPKAFKYKITVSELLTKQLNITLEPNKLSSINTKLTFPKPVISQPYWLLSDHTLGSYKFDNIADIGLPENKAPFSAVFSIRIGDHVITSTRPVVYKYTDQVRGEVDQSIAITPPVTATLSEKGYTFNGNEPQKVLFTLQSFRDNASGIIQPILPPGWKSSPQTINFQNFRKGQAEQKEFIITPAGKIENGEIIIQVKLGNETYNQGFKEIEYDHIPVQTLFPKSRARVEKIDLKITGKNIAYLSGAGDLVAESLKQIGYQVTILRTEQLLNTELSTFDAIITGVRLYNTNQDVKIIQPKLLDYVSKGGVLVVQYNVNNPLLIPNLGPYPFKLSRDRVTEENAPVTFIAPDHQVLNYPNKITQKDFEGWVQERGLYFATEIDKAYLPVISLNDTGEKPNPGSLLVSNYGKGKFVYTSLAFFRQLPAGVPGAYRLFINLLSK
ncbi:MAG: LmbE family protein, partial [Pyrinomonadaceae bacterium]|nr:LmbE family protein [Sphingobacteriaceae bacterium]